MVALYCTAFPEDAYRYEKNEQEREAANERYYDELSYRIASHISNMSVSRLRSELLNILLRRSADALEYFMCKYSIPAPEYPDFYEDKNELKKPQNLCWTPWKKRAAA